MRDRYPKHGPRRPWYAPWRLWCRCGLEGYPCAVVRMQQRQRQERAARVAAALERYDGALEAARQWQREQRQRWADGAR
jgi:hypothetical protein